MVHRRSFVITLVVVCAVGLFAMIPVVLRAGGPSDTESKGCYCVGRVGNVNCDYADMVDVADLQFLVDHMFLSLVRLPNLEEANCDGVPGSGVDIADLQALLDHLFLSRADLPDCPRPFNKAPYTAITSPVAQYYINDEVAFYPSTGISMSWRGWDLVDFPYTTPEFEFEWRLYGPYTDDTFQQLLDSFVVRVFITNHDQVFKQGQPPEIVCDTVVDGLDTSINCTEMPTYFYVCDTSYDGGVRTIVCDTMLIDSIRSSNAYGRLDTLLDVEHPAFVDPFLPFNKIAASSFDGVDHAVTDTMVTIYDVFPEFPHDTTVQMNFLFWVQALDPADTTVRDIAPPFAEVSVVDPSHERDIAVINWDLPDEINGVSIDTVRSFWADAIPAWAASRGLDSLDFDAERDVFPVTLYTAGTEQSKFQKLLFSYKAAVMVSHGVTHYLFGDGNQSVMTSTYNAIEAGVDTWVAMRSPVGPYSLGSPPYTRSTSSDYAYYFGAEQVRYSGWGQFWMGTTVAWRIEDFVGAFSQNTNEWPDLAVDTGLLHRRYDWWGPYHWHPDSLDMLGRFAIPQNVASMPLGALPDVGWCVRSSDTEAMYLYQSLYGAEHFLGYDYSFNGRPVMHRLDRGHFRTVHSMFTPLAFEQESAQELVNSVLDFLYDDASGAPPDRADRPVIDSERGN